YQVLRRAPGTMHRHPAPGTSHGTPHPAPRTPHPSLLHPLRDEQVRLPRALRITVRSPDQFLSVRAPHGEAVKIRVGSDPLESGAILVDHIEIERAASGTEVVGRKNDTLPIRVIERREVGAS